MTILSISSVSTAPVAPNNPSVNSPTPAPKAAPVTRVATPLDPPVKFDVRRDETPAADEPASKSDIGLPTADERRVTVDQDTKSIVYQVVDPDSGDVVVQLPEATLLRARAYAEATANRASAFRATEDEQPVDRTA